MVTTPFVPQEANSVTSFRLANLRLLAGILTSLTGGGLTETVKISQLTPGTTNGVQTLTGSTTAVTQATGTNLHAVIDSGTITTVTTVTAVTGITNALPAGTNLLGKTGIDQTTPGTTNKVDTTKQGTFTHTQPTIVSGGSGTTALASNAARRYLFIQNNSGANIAVNLNNNSVTSLTPASGNLCFVLAPGASYESPAGACPTANIVVFQASGGSINSVSIVEA